MMLSSRHQSKKLTKSSSSHIRKLYFLSSLSPVAPELNTTTDNFTTKSKTYPLSTRCNSLTNTCGWKSRNNNNSNANHGSFHTRIQYRITIPSSLSLQSTQSKFSLYAYNKPFYFSTITNNEDNDSKRNDNDDGDDDNGDLLSLLDKDGHDDDGFKSASNATNDTKGSLLSLLSDEESFTNISSSQENDNDSYGVSSHEKQDDASEISMHQQNQKQQTQAKKTKTKTKYKKRKRKKPKPPQQLSQHDTTISTTIVPKKQSKRNARTLFDSIAPHINDEMSKQFLDDMDAFAQFMENEYTFLHDMNNNIDINLDDNEASKSSKKKLRKKKKRRNSKSLAKEIAEYKTTIGMIDAFLNRKKARRKKSKAASAAMDDNNDSWKKHQWIKSLLAQFFANNDSEQFNKTKSENSNDHDLKEQTEMTIGLNDLWNDADFTPNINRIHYEKNVNILMRAREMSVEKPLFWSHAQKKKQRLLTNRNKELLQSNNDVNVHVTLKEGGMLEEGKKGDAIIAFDEEAKTVHSEKSSQILRKEAEDLACLLADRLPADIHDNVMTMFEEYAGHLDSIINANGKNLHTATTNLDTGGDGDDDDKNVPSLSFDKKYKDILDTANKISSEEQSKKGRPPMRMFFQHLERNADFHVHLIAPEVATFLYIDVPWIKNSLVSTSSKDQDGLHDRYKTIHNDPRLAEAWKCWLSLRDALVKTFIRSQYAYCKLQEAIRESEKLDSQKAAKSVSKPPSENKIKFSSGEHSTAEELLEELDMMRTRKNGEKVGHDWSKEESTKGRFPTKATLRYECYMLNERFGPYADQETSILADLDDSNEMVKEICPEIVNQLPSTNRTIFVDNLPINIDEEELLDLYSRCGEIESTEIFNLRPDLDPGEPKVETLKKLRKKRRLTGIKNVKYSRSRTPVYAMITFKDNDGFKRANNDMLRIFGMVIRRHAVKSYAARNLRKLHIENIPDGFYAIDIEEKLCKLLQPNMYLSLQIGQHVNSQPRNLILMFPSFEVAYFAYQKLQSLNFESEECTLNWMPTPKDSMAYWTREIVPDP